MLCAAPVMAEDVNLVNSRDWPDVYSVMLHSALNGERGHFLNSESIVALARILPQDSVITVYESDRPYIPNLQNQLESAGYTVEEVVEADDFNIELARSEGEVVVASEDNFRLAMPLASYASNTGSWVYIVNEERLDEIADLLPDAGSVLATGNFRRDYLDALEGEFDTWVNNNNVYVDSQEIAERFPEERKTVVLTDGSDIEDEYFSTKNPVVLSGGNKLVDLTFDYLQQNDIKSVIVVGNRLATVGEQIRSRSDRTISVFVKFGQSDAQGLGRIYALSLFPLPTPDAALTVNDVVFNPGAQEVVAYFENTGNIGVYELSTISVKNGEEEIATSADEESVFVGAGEVLPVRYDVEMAPAEVSNETLVEFYTSYGTTPNALDEFLTMENEYGPPFALPLRVDTIEAPNVSLQLDNVVYYDGLNRIGVDLTNPSDADLSLRIRIQQLIVNGLPEDLVKPGELDTGETKTFYLPVELDEIDLEENDEFDVSIVYGPDENTLFGSLQQQVPFAYESSSFLTSPVGLALIGGVVLVIIVVAFFLLRKE